MDFDRQMGALFGLVKGVLWCLLITFFAVTLSETTRQWVLQSRSGYYTALLIQHGTPILPEDVRNVLGKYIKRLDEGLEEGETGGLMVDTPISDLEDASRDLASEFGLSQSQTITNFREEAKSLLGTPVSDLRQGSGELASEFGQFQSRTLTSLRDDAKGFIDSRASEFERRVEDRGEQIQGEVREAMRRGINELDSQIKRLPLEPVDR